MCIVRLELYFQAWPLRLHRHVEGSRTLEGNGGEASSRSVDAMKTRYMR